MDLLSPIVRSPPVDNEFQLTTNTEDLEKILGVKVGFLRPPYGSYNDGVLRVAAAHNQSVIIWDFEYVCISPTSYVN